jgi:hypothetical protein
VRAPFAVRPSASASFAGSTSRPALRRYSASLTASAASYAACSAALIFVSAGVSVRPPPYAAEMSRGRAKTPHVPTAGL